MLPMFVCFPSPAAEEQCLECSPMPPAGAHQEVVGRGACTSTSTTATASIIVTDN